MPTNSDEKDRISLLLWFEKITHIFPRDMFEGDDYFLFVVPTGMKGKAIGSMGINLKRMRSEKNKHILISELFDDPKKMIASYFDNITILKIKVNDNKYLIYVPDEHRGKAIGKNGHRIKAFKQLFKKYFNDAEVSIRAISVIGDTPTEKNSYSLVDAIELNQIKSDPLAEKKIVFEKGDTGTQQ